MVVNSALAIPAYAGSGKGTNRIHEMTSPSSVRDRKASAMTDTQLRAQGPDGDDSRAIWLDQARHILWHDGAGAISVAAMARDLHLSRAAFYWHFANREELLRELLDDCIRQSRLAMFGRLEHLPFEHGLLELLDLCIIPDAIERKAMQFDLVLQKWATSEPWVACKLAGPERQKHGQIARFLKRHGMSGAESQIRAGYLMRLLRHRELPEAICARHSYPTILETLFRVTSGRRVHRAVLSHHLNHRLPRRRRDLPLNAAVPSGRLQAPP